MTYDAAYLELAPRQTLPLASLDGFLRAAGIAAVVHYWEANRETGAASRENFA